MSAHTPPVKWAQRKDSLFLTIDIPDVKDSTIELTASHLVFKCVSSASQRFRAREVLLGHICRVAGAVGAVLWPSQALMPVRIRCSRLCVPGASLT